MWRMGLVCAVVMVATGCGGSVPSDALPLQRAGHTTAVGSSHLAAGAHTVAVDPQSHHSFFPLPNGPVLLEFEPSK
jgi:hypothetical protein